MMNSVIHASPRRGVMVALAAVALPLMIAPLSPVLSAVLGVAAAHLWLFSLPREMGALIPTISPLSWVVAASGLGWLVAGMMLLASQR